MEVLMPKPGAYVVAVSGGVDSVVLLDVLRRQPGLRLVVAHFDHGMRQDSEQDRLFVQKLAAQHKLPFVYDEGRLGAGASEAKARQARYAFLRQAQHAAVADAIITAHHQDDRLETAILNLLRGTGRKGLTALGEQPDLLRPLLKLPKSTLVGYARTYKLLWREDPTNANDTYLRNYVRQRILPRFSEAGRRNMLQIIDGLALTNKELDLALAEALGAHSSGRLDRQWFAHLPHEVAREVLAAWLRANGVRDFDSKMLERLVVAAKTAQPGKSFPVRTGMVLEVHAGYLALGRLER